MLGFKGIWKELNVLYMKVMIEKCLYYVLKYCQMKGD